MSIKENILEKIKKSIAEKLQSMGASNPVIVVEIPPSKSLGDYAFPMFKFAGVLKTNPTLIAQTVANTLQSNNLVDRADIGGPYLNIFLKKQDTTRDIINEIMDKKESFGKKPRNNKNFVVEFSCPNTNKPLHLGHCRNNVLGDSIARILDAEGYNVTKINLINDRGVHICKSMLAYKLFGNETTPENENKKSDHLVGDFYVKFAQEEKKNPKLEKQAQEMLVLWEKKDPEVLELWEKMNKWAIDGIKETYKAMEITFDQYEYESENYILGKDIVQEGLKKGVLYQKDDGSIWIDNSDIGLDEKILLRNDGTSIYMTQDLGTATKRYDKYKFDSMIYVVGSEQEYHFKTLFATLKKLGFKWADQCYHLSYGMVNLPDGKMKSREGNVVDADNLMNLLYKLALEVLLEKQRDLPENEKAIIAKDISLAALKYYLLNFSTTKDISFDPKQSISFDGNTGPYIQYTTARLNSLLTKADFDFTHVDYKSLDINDDEWSIASLLLEYEEAITHSAQNRTPNDICTFLYNLARNYNKFYHDNMILTADSKNQKNFRLQLSSVTRIVLVNGLNLLGIKALDKM